MLRVLSRLIMEPLSEIYIRPTYLGDDRPLADGKTVYDLYINCNQLLKSRFIPVFLSPDHCHPDCAPRGRNFTRQQCARLGRDLTPQQGPQWGRHVLKETTARTKSHTSKVWTAGEEPHASAELDGDETSNADMVHDGDGTTHIGRGATGMRPTPVHHRYSTFIRGIVGIH